MKPNRSLVNTFGAVAAISAGVFFGAGLNDLSNPEGVWIDDHTLIVPPSSDIRAGVIEEYFYDCRTKRDDEKQIAVTTCKIGSAYK